MTALKPKHIDLYQSFFEKPPRSRKDERRIAAILFPVFVTLIMAGYYAIIQLDIDRLSTRIEPVMTYLNTIDTQTLHQKADMLRQEDNTITLLAEKMRLLEDAVDSYPHLGKSMMESIYSEATDKVNIVELAYDGEKCIIGISIEIDTPEMGLGYMSRLRRTGHFLAMAHLGYTGGTILKPVYKMEIFAMLPPPREV